MLNAIKQILEPYLLKLPDLRGTPSLWTEYKCMAATDQQGYFTDANQQQRNNLLVALFYDQRSSDENLLRYLLKQEIEMHKQLPLQGVCESLKINIGLLSRFRNTSNIELFIDAKQANFDTQCALDTISFVSPGLWKSYSHLPNLTEQHKQTFIEALGPTEEECVYTDDQASDWIDNQAGLLPAALDKLSLEDEIYLAHLLGDSKVVSNKITTWITGIKKWDKEHYQKMYGYETMRDNIQGQIDALKKIGAYETDKTKAKQLNYYHIGELYLKQKNTAEAYKNICLSLDNYAEPMQWGACRMYVDRFLDIIMATNNRSDPKCAGSFKWMKQYLDYEPWTSNWDTKIIPRIMTASTIMGENDTMMKFAELFRIRKKEEHDKLHS